MRPDASRQLFSKFIANTALPHVNIHSLRHTNATLQIAGGVPIVTIAKRLGHSSQNVTGDIYAHAVKSANEAAAETLENILTPTKNRETGKNKKTVAASKSKTTA